MSWSGRNPKALEICTRSFDPPTERCTICRRVASLSSSGTSEFCGSGSCCDVAHVPTHVADPAGADCVVCALTAVALHNANARTTSEVDILFIEFTKVDYYEKAA